MSISRRQALGAGLALGAGVGIAGCGRLYAHFAPSPLGDAAELPPGDNEPGVRWWNRVGFGPAPGDLRRLKDAGVEGMTRWALAADQQEDPYLILQTQRIEAETTSAADMQYEPFYEVIRQIQQAAVLRAVHGANPLLERMCDFWTNHFNTYARKGKVMYRKALDVDSVIRAHALGKFPEMLLASARSPAMLESLDNELSRRGAPNENYARELMELHTLGVHGGYTQKDVHEVARCFTGWTLEDRLLRRRGTYRFDADLHDDGPKMVLGRRIEPSGGEADGLFVLDLLANHPTTAHRLASKLCQYFVGIQEGPDVDAAADAFLQTGGDIRATMGSILRSSSLVHGPSLPKRPLDFVASSLRTLGARTDGDTPLLKWLEQMGQTPYDWPMPDGYPLSADSWTGSMLARWNFVQALLNGEIAGTDVDLAAIRRRATTDRGAFALGLGREVPAMPELEAEMRKLAQPEARLALCLCSPEFQWR